MWKKTLKIFAVIIIGLGLSLIFIILLLRWIDPPFTAFTLQADWDEFDQEYYSLRTNWIPAEELSEQMVWAVVAAEDQLFFEHYGFDVQSIEDAWEDYREGERTRGASTISQQVAKNLFLSPAQSFLRKGIEAGITVLIELFWTKDRIIEVYLNVAEFGPGVYGVGKASQVYFSRPAGQLTPEMAARLAAVLPSPKRMRVNPPSPYAQERSRWILRQMNQLSGKIYHSFEEKPSRAEPDSAAVDSSTQTNSQDSLDFDLSPDTLFRSLPDISEPVSDTTDSVQIY